MTDGSHEDLTFAANPHLRTPQSIVMDTSSSSFYFYFQLFRKLTQFISHNGSNLSSPFYYTATKQSQGSHDLPSRELRNRSCDLFASKPFLTLYI